MGKIRGKIRVVMSIQMFGQNYRPFATTCNGHWRDSSKSLLNLELLKISETLPEIRLPVSIEMSLT